MESIQVTQGAEPQQLKNTYQSCNYQKRKTDFIFYWTWEEKEDYKIDAVVRGEEQYIIIIRLFVNKVIL